VLFLVLSSFCFNCFACRAGNQFKEKTVRGAKRNLAHTLTSDTSDLSSLEFSPHDTTHPPPTHWPHPTSSYSYPILAPSTPQHYRGKRASPPLYTTRSVDFISSWKGTIILDVPVFLSATAQHFLTTSWRASRSVLELCQVRECIEIYSGQRCISSLQISLAWAGMHGHIVGSPVYSCLVCMGYFLMLRESNYAGY